MQVRPGAHAGAAGEPELLPLNNRLPDGHAQNGPMRIERLEPVTHVDEDDIAVAVEARGIPDRRYPAGARSDDVERAQGADVDPCMPLRPVVAEPARDDPVRRPLEDETGPR